jgi:hypothetical protein
MPAGFSDWVCCFSELLCLLTLWRLAREITEVQPSKMLVSCLEKAYSEGAYLSTDGGVPRSDSFLQRSSLALGGWSRSAGV